MLIVLYSIPFKDSGPLAVDLTCSLVRGRLRKFVNLWRTLEVSHFILNVIMQGYKIPFFQLPTPFAKGNNTSARENSDFVSHAVNDLLRLDLIEELACKPNIINPLSVSIRSSGKQRLILTLSPVTTTLKIFRTTENFSPSLGILAPWCLQIFSILRAPFRSLFRSIYFH